jgi:hypothetical protein
MPRMSRPFNPELLAKVVVTVVVIAMFLMWASQFGPSLFGIGAKLGIRVSTETK